MTLKKIKIPLTKYEKVIEFLEQEYPNINTQSTKIVGIINELKRRPQTQTVERAWDGYRERLLVLKQLRDEEVEKNTATEKECERFIPLTELKKMWLEAEPSKYKLITGYYIWYPALRGDWAFVKVVDGKFVFESFLKRKKSDNQGDLTKEIVPELKDLLEFLPELPDNPKAFLKLLKRASDRLFGKEINLNMYRKIHVYENKDKSTAERKTIAKQMNHTLQIADYVYKKLNFGDC